jgi:hypothetical protein
VAIAEVWRRDSDRRAFRVEVDYGRSGGRRSVIVDETGHVLERSHEIGSREIPRGILDAAESLGEGSIERAEMVQGEPGVEHYRFWLRADDGSRAVALCPAAGQPVFELIHVVTAELLVGPAR